MQPHDHLFRHVFSQPEHAAGELKTVLPAALTAEVDWSTLELVPGSFVDPSLQELRSDLLFTATLSGRRALFYVLLEHQSSSDPFMPFRLLGYMMRIWEHERREHPEANRLPAIVPVVVSHDDAGWIAPTSFAELLDVPPELSEVMRPQMVDFDMLLDDLSKARDDELGRRAKMTALGLLALFFLERARTSEDFVGELMERLDLLREVVGAPNGMASLAVLLRYASIVTDTRPERLRVVVQALGPKSEVILMSAAEEWMMEGRAQGKAQAVLSVLDARGLAVSVAERERIAKCTDLALLDSWLRRVGTVATVAEVLAD